MGNLNERQFSGQVEVHGYDKGEKVPTEIRTFPSHAHADAFLNDPVTKSAPLKYQKYGGK